MESLIVEDEHANKFSVIWVTSPCWCGDDLQHDEVAKTAAY
jgi:hypothetical protein